MATDVNDTRILIVEDEVIIAADLKSRLESLGYDVCDMVGSAEKAMAMVEQNPPDILIMDIVVKGRLDGLEAAEVIRNRWGIPVILLSAHTDSDKLERAKLTYPFGYLVKPFRDIDLKITVEMALYLAKQEAERRKAEDALRESEEKFRSITEQMAETVFLTDPLGTISYMSPIAVRIFGFQPEEMENRHFTEFLSDESVETAISAFMETMDKGLAVENLGLWMQRKDGSVFYGELTANVFRKQGVEAGTIGVIRDMTQQKRAEDALRESEERFRAIFESTSDFVFLKDRELRYIKVNPAMEDLLGEKADNLIGKRNADFIGAEKAAHLEKADGRVLQGETIEHEDIIPVKGQIYTFDIKKTPVHGPEGEVVGLCGIARDITGRKNAEKALKQSQHYLANIFDGIQDGISVLNTDLTIRQVNRVMVKWYGENLPLEGQKCHLAYHNADRPCDPCPSSRCLKSGQMEFNIVPGPSGSSVKWLEVLSFPIKDPITGEITEVVEVVRDISERLLAEEALRESEQRMELALAGAALGTWDWNIRTGEVAFNERWTEMLGYGINELEPHVSTWETLLHPDDMPYVMETLNAHLEDGTDYYETEHRLIHKSGKYIWVLDKGRVIERDADGTPLRACGTHLDITERKHAEEALNHSESLLRAILESLPVGVNVLENRVIKQSNSTMARLSGYSMEELNGLPAKVLYPSEEVSERVGETLYSQIEREGQGEAETQWVRKDGSLFHVWVRVYSLEAEGGKSGPVVGVVEDVTERRKSERALRESEEKFRQIVQASPMGIHMYELHTKDRLVFIGANQAADRILGVDHQQFVGKTIEEAFPPLAQTEIPERYRRAAADGISWNTEMFDYKDQRLEGAFEVHAFQTAPGRATVLFLDITERKRAEEEKARLEAQLMQAQKMEAIGTLAGGVAHDFNNLLQAISGYSQVLLLRKDKNHDEYKKLDAIQKACERAAQLVQKLLFFSRKAESERKSLDLNKEIDQARRMLERTIPKMIEINLHLGSRIKHINADPVQIEQILLNLGTNAADAMPEGGRLAIETENMVLDEEYARNHLEAKPGRYVLVTVSDTGQGMDEETQHKIFDPFFTTKEIGKGTGLGLASVYGIVKNHGGYINCYSEVGQGTTFKVYLPAIEQADNFDTSELDEPPKGGNEVILLVDDEESIRDFASETLGQNGYKVFTASSGEEALDVFSRMAGEIDLVILDIGMPGIGGHKCLVELLKLDPSAKVIVTSGYSIEGHVKKTLEVGAMGYVGKPYQLNNLLKKVRAVLDEAA